MTARLGRNRAQREDALVGGVSWSRKDDDDENVPPDQDSAMTVTNRLVRLKLIPQAVGYHPQSAARTKYWTLCRTQRRSPEGKLTQCWAHRDA